MEQVKAYVKAAIEGFENDPPDTNYQEGYLAALKVIWSEALHMPNWDRKPFSNKP